MAVLSPTAIPTTAQLEAAATKDRIDWILGLIVGLLVIVIGALLLVFGVTANTGGVELPLPGGSVLKLTAVPAGVLFAIIGLIIIWISRPTVAK